MTAISIVGLKWKICKHVVDVRDGLRPKVSSPYRTPLYPVGKRRRRRQRRGRLMRLRPGDEGSMAGEAASMDAKAAMTASS